MGLADPSGFVEHPRVVLVQSVGAGEPLFGLLEQPLRDPAKLPLLKKREKRPGIKKVKTHTHRIESMHAPRTRRARTTHTALLPLSHRAPYIAQRKVGRVVVFSTNFGLPLDPLTVPCYLGTRGASSIKFK